jgi:predicted ATPase
MVLLERDAPLSQLREMLVEARRGRGRVALVIGEAGIGKTSLVDAFCAAAPPSTRILWGTCDPIRPPRPFTPLADIADRVGGDLRRALAAGGRDGVLDAMLFELRRRDTATTVIVFDDLHWADDATLDLLQAIGRRVARLPLLLIGTYRDHDVAVDHPLRLTFGDIPAMVISEIRLPPLSMAAVERLGRGKVDARAVHEATGGNAFFVSEVLAGGWRGVEPVPTTVRDAVLTRLARLGSDAQRAARAAAVLGPGTAIATVLDVAQVGREAIDECVAHALLVLRDGTVSFRHELARLAVVDALPREECARLHRSALHALRAPPPVDWPRLARHAIAAGDRAAILELAPTAGRAAAGLGAHREAGAFFGAALDHAEGMTPTEHADMLERYAHELSLTDDVVRAVPAQRRALAIWRSVGDRVREGGCLTELSGLLWLAGEGEEAMSMAQEAVDLLTSAASGSPELAWATAVLAQRRLIAGGDDRATLASANVAVDLAERLGYERVAVHALTTAAVARIFLGEPVGWTLLEEAVERSRAASLPEETARAMINLVETARDFRRFDLAERYIADATGYLEDHDLDFV